jgi:uncharacterized protein (DUF3820 family)
VDKQLVAEIIASFALPGVQDKDLPEGDPTKIKAKAICDAFTSGVGFLRSAFPNENVRKLMRLVWQICGSKIVPVAMGPNVPTLSFGKYGPRAIIFTPSNWIDLIQKDPVCQMGAVVFVGSQAADQYNDRLSTLEQGQESSRRARAYEAEYLHTIRKLARGHEFNAYQKAVLADMPEGLASAKDIFYEYKPFIAVA